MAKLYYLLVLAVALAVAMGSPADLERNNEKMEELAGKAMSGWTAEEKAQGYKLDAVEAPAEKSYHHPKNYKISQMMEEKKKILENKERMVNIMKAPKNVQRMELEKKNVEKERQMRMMGNSRANKQRMQKRVRSPERNERVDMKKIHPEYEHLMEKQMAKKKMAAAKHFMP